MLLIFFLKNRPASKIVKIDKLVSYFVFKTDPDLFTSVRGNDWWKQTKYLASTTVIKGTLSHHHLMKMDMCPQKACLTWLIRSTFSKLNSLLEGTRGCCLDKSRGSVVKFRFQIEPWLRRRHGEQWEHVDYSNQAQITFPSFTFLHPCLFSVCRMYILLIIEDKTPRERCEKHGVNNTDNNWTTHFCNKKKTNKYFLV